MNEEVVSKGTILTTFGWFTVVALMAAAWTLAIMEPEHWLIAGMLAATSCASSALAAVLHIRTYAVRVCCLVRKTAGLQVPDSPANIHTLR